MQSRYSLEAISPLKNRCRFSLAASWREKPKSRAKKRNRDEERQKQNCGTVKL
jgi:hypothetical protein